MKLLPLTLPRCQCFQGTGFLEFTMAYSGESKFPNWTYPLSKRVATTSFDPGNQKTAQWSLGSGEKIVWESIHTSERSGLFSRFLVWRVNDVDIIWYIYIDITYIPDNICKFDMIGTKSRIDLYDIHRFLDITWLALQNIQIYCISNHIRDDPPRAHVYIYLYIYIYTLLALKPPSNLVFMGSALQPNSSKTQRLVEEKQHITGNPWFWTVASGKLCIAMEHPHLNRYIKQSIYIYGWYRSYVS